MLRRIFGKDFERRCVCDLTAWLSELGPAFMLRSSTSRWMKVATF